ncbi:hypothetical protein [Micromonospora matsumotoense]|uniref:hypothetical protein n=1 Tax=Micromonospora matsumotoense TaxID=121616 RepID=UPI003402312F
MDFYERRASHAGTASEERKLLWAHTLALLTLVVGSMLALAVIGALLVRLGGPYWPWPLGIVTFAAGDQLRAWRVKRQSRRAQA